jgi:NHLM bacteriocin system ABC transporter ATP-binding protein
MSEPALPATAAMPPLPGGEPLVLTGNSPLRLDTSPALWLVESGRFEIFAAPESVLAAGPWTGLGARSHFATATAGHLLCGLAALDGAGRPGGAQDQAARAATAAAGVGLLAVAAPSGRLLRWDLEALRGLAAEPALRPALAALLDGWLGLVAAALVTGPGPRAFAELRPGVELDLEAAGRAARPREGIVWVRQLSGSSELLARRELTLAAGELAPLAEDGWLIATAPSRLAAAGTAELLEEDELWAALARFHRQLLPLLAERDKASEHLERDRLARKTALEGQLLHAAYERLAAVLTARPPAAEGLGELAAAEPLLAACRLVARAQGMPFRGRPEGAAGGRRGEHLASLCTTARVRYRRVILRDVWWRRDNGPLIGFLAALEQGAARPVALLPVSRTSYELVDPAAGRRVAVNEAVADSLAPEAFMLYKPLPERQVTARDLVRAALSGRRGDLWTLALMGLASGLLALLVPIVTGQVFGHVIPDADRPGLRQVTLVLVVSALAASAFQLTRSFAVVRLSAGIESRVQAAVWDRLLALPVAFFRGFTVGDLADRSLGIERIREVLTGNVTISVLSAVFSFFSFGLLFYYSWQLALAATALVAALVVATAALTWLQLRHQRDLLALQGKIASLLLGFIRGISKLRVAAAEQRAFSRWAERFAEQRRHSLRARRIANVQAAFNAGYGVLTTLAIFAMVAWSSGAALPVGEFLAFNAAFGQFLAAALGTVSLLSSILAIVPLYERLQPILAARPEVDAEKAEAGELAGELECSHVSFRYDEKGPMVLDEVSFHARAGEFIALVGPSGSGKSTCLRLILGFEQPAAGSIYFDGQDLKALGIQSVRRQIGVVMQHSRLAAGDIFTNIVGGSNRTLEEAWEAARMAGLEEDIRAMPMGMHTVVSEGAETFSGGQKQRLLIARAIVNRPRILLFDEATSALDNRTQELVSRSLERLKATRIVIAHRLSTIVNADRIYVIDAGRVMETGSYRELVVGGGIFAELARRQVS